MGKIDLVRCDICECEIWLGKGWSSSIYMYILSKILFQDESFLYSIDHTYNTIND